MQYRLIAQILIDASILITIVAVIALSIQFLRTRNAGFLWLIAAIFVWPRIGGFGIRSVIQRYTAHQPLTWYPANLVQKGKISIGTLILSLNAIQEIVAMILLMVAIFYLGRKILAVTPSQVS
jgi:hypothetical protein